MCHKGSGKQIFHFFEVFRSSFQLSSGEKIILHAKAFPKSHPITTIETTNFAFYLGFNDVSLRDDGCVMKSEISPKSMWPLIKVIV